MKPSLTKPVQAFLIVFVLILSAHSERTTAQTPSPTPAATAASQLLSITVVSVRPEMLAEFQNFMKYTTNPALQKGGVPWRAVWQNTPLSGDAFEYIMVAPVGKLAEFDGPSALEKGLGAQGFAAWQAKAGSLVTSVRRFIVRSRPDLSFEMPRSGPPKLAIVATLQIGVNRNLEFENFVKNDYLPVMKKAQVSYQVSQLVYGGDTNEYVTLTLQDSFADLDKGQVVTQTLGMEGAMKLVQKLPAGVVTRLERSVSKFVTELSLMPPAQ